MGSVRRVVLRAHLVHGVRCIRRAPLQAAHPQEHAPASDSVRAWERVPALVSALVWAEAPEGWFRLLARLRARSALDRMHAVGGNSIRRPKKAR